VTNGPFDVGAELGPGGEVLRLRLDLGGDAVRPRLEVMALQGMTGLVSRRVWDDDEPARYLTVHDPVDAADSGWWVSTRDESQEYVNDPDNVCTVRLANLVGAYPALEKHLDAPPGSQVRLDDEDVMQS
jgi:hypothetical protein